MHLGLLVSSLLAAYFLPLHSFPLPFHLFFKFYYTLLPSFTFILLFCLRFLFNYFPFSFYFFCRFILNLFFLLVSVFPSFSIYLRNGWSGPVHAASFVSENPSHNCHLVLFCIGTGIYWGRSVAEWLACWTQALKGLGSNRSRDAVG